MGNEEAKPVKKGVSIAELQTYIMIIQAKLTQSRNKKVVEIRKKRDEAVKYIEDKNIDMAKLKIEGMMRNEDLISAFDILSVLCEILKEKVTYILTSPKCPEDLKASLDTAIYASTRIDIDEFHKLRDIINYKYGEKYVLEANSNKRELVNVNIVKKLSLSPYADVLLSARLRSVANEAGIDLGLPEEVLAPITNFSNPFVESQQNNNYNEFNQNNQNNFNNNNTNTYTQNQQYMVSGQNPISVNQQGDFTGGNQYYAQNNQNNMTNPVNYYNPDSMSQNQQQYPNIPQMGYDPNYSQPYNSQGYPNINSSPSGNNQNNSNNHK